MNDSIKNDEISRKIQTIANITIIVAAFLIICVLARDFFAQRPTIRGISVGTHVSLPEIDFTHAGRTLIFALRQGCRYCDDSMPFYKRVLSKTKVSRNTRAVAILQQIVAMSRKYLENFGLEIDDVKQIRFAEIGIGPTPTVLLVNRQGNVEHVWIEKLSAGRKC